MKTLLATMIFAGSLSSASAATYTIQNWPQDLSKVPCDAWHRNSDGSWTEVATIIVGTNPTSGMVFKDTDEAKIINDKCHH